ncbi:hypothetical protein D5S18_26060 [Nocardia panacis]|uniref:DUF3592 domain-containing protein n=1 Tax=Nocardia panacis TaxID=2340916 RepID=A0A3A4KMB4_9NOCA|nr:hypothetical protein D5S18_26060 [Nocardia panacis]
MRAGPSGVKQTIFLAFGVSAGVLLAVSVPRVGRDPLWLLALLPAVWIVMIGMIVVSAWRMKTAVLGSRRSALGPVEYLAAVSAVAGSVLSIPGSAQTVRLAGGASLILALLMLTLMVVGYLIRWRRRIAASGLRARAVRARGVVISTGLEGFPATPNPKVVRLSVAFTDRAGTRRWLTPTALQVPAHPIAVDDEVAVWFDPEHPGDIARIVVEFDNGSSRIVRTG